MVFFIKVQKRGHYNHHDTGLILTTKTAAPRYGVKEMGEIAEDMIDGLACQCCGCYFVKNGELYEHGYPVTCWDCWDDLTPEQRKEHIKADVQTL